MEKRFEGKTALITGATSGIGRASALGFAESGARVAAVGRNKGALAELEHELRGLGSDPVLVCADVTDDADVDRIIDAVRKEFNGLDVLVNAAGHIATGTIENTQVAEWDRMMNVNLRALFVLMQAALPLLELKSGNIVNVSSVNGLRAFSGVLAYCVSKAGVDQLTHCAALELAPKGIRVNSVNPGVVVTEIHKRGGMDDDTYQTFLERCKQTHPLGRVGTAREVAELIMFLASDSASWITGASYSIDGGRAQTCAR